MALWSRVALAKQICSASTVLPVPGEPGQDDQGSHREPAPEDQVQLRQTGAEPSQAVFASRSNNATLSSNLRPDEGLGEDCIRTAGFADGVRISAHHHDSQPGRPRY